MQNLKRTLRTATVMLLASVILCLLGCPGDDPPYNPGNDTWMYNDYGSGYDGLSVGTTANGEDEVITSNNGSLGDRLRSRQLEQGWRLEF